MASNLKKKTASKIYLQKSTYRERAKKVEEKGRQRDERKTREESDGVQHIP